MRLLRTASRALVAVPLLVSGQGPADPTVPIDPGQAVSARSAELCTTFQDNGGHDGNMFDITPIVSITIDSFDINSRAAAGTTASFDFFYRVGTSFGFENDPTAWTFVGNYAGLSNGRSLPSNVSVAGNGVLFLAGQIYGIYLDAGAGGGLAYTNGGPNTYSNADLSLTTNCGKAAGFGATFIPRIWNGCVHYSVGGPPLTLDVTGTCPGVLDFHVTGASPGGKVGLIAARALGSTIVPSGHPCAGTVLDLDGSACLVSVLTADQNGEIDFSQRVSAPLCGRVVLQALDESSCASSNTIRL